MRSELTVSQNFPGTVSAGGEWTKQEDLLRTIVRNISNCKSPLTPSTK